MNNHLELKSWMMLINDGLTPLFSFNIPIMQRVTTSLKDPVDFETMQLEFHSNADNVKTFSIYPYAGNMKTKKEIAREAV